MKIQPVNSSRGDGLFLLPVEVRMVETTWTKEGKQELEAAGLRALNPEEHCVILQQVDTGGTIGGIPMTALVAAAAPFTEDGAALHKLWETRPGGIKVNILAIDKNIPCIVW